MWAALAPLWGRNSEPPQSLCRSSCFCLERAWSCRSAGGISRGLLCPSGRRFCLECCRPRCWDFSVPLHLPCLTLCETNTFPQLLMLLEAAWALRQQHLLSLCFPTTCAQMLMDVFCPSVPSLLQLHSPYVQTWIPKLLFRERRVRVLIVIVYIWIKYVYVSANNVFFCILCKLVHNIWLCRELFRGLDSIPEEKRNWPKVWELLP